MSNHPNIQFSFEEAIDLQAAVNLACASICETIPASHRDYTSLKRYQELQKKLDKHINEILYPIK